MIAQVVGVDDVISVTPTLDTSAYASGDRLGSIHTITGAFRRMNRSYDNNPAIAKDAPNQCAKVILQNIVIIDQALQSQPIDILFFDELPVVASVDNAAIDIADAEMIAKCIGSVSIDNPYIALAANSIVTESNIGLLLKQKSTAADGNLYAVCIIRGIATYAASSLVFRYGFLQD